MAEGLVRARMLTGSPPETLTVSWGRQTCKGYNVELIQGWNFITQEWHDKEVKVLKVDHIALSLFGPSKILLQFFPLTQR